MLNGPGHWGLTITPTVVTVNNDDKEITVVGLSCSDRRDHNRMTRAPLGFLFLLWPIDGLEAR